jgi:hypothetical protein
VPGLRRNRAWKLLWSGQAVSLVGDYVFQTTIVLWIGTVIARGQTPLSRCLRVSALW